MTRQIVRDVFDAPWACRHNEDVFRPVARLASGLVTAPFLLFSSLLAPVHVHESAVGHSDGLARRLSCSVSIEVVMRMVVRGATLPLGLVILLFGAPAVCRAQTRLSVRDAVDIALRSRALLKAETERVNVAQGRKRQAGLL